MRQGLATFLELALCIYKNYENFAEDVNSLASEMKNLIRTPEAGTEYIFQPTLFSLP